MRLCYGAPIAVHTESRDVSYIVSTMFSRILHSISSINSLDLEPPSAFHIPPEYPSNQPFNPQKVSRLSKVHRYGTSTDFFRYIFIMAKQCSNPGCAGKPSLWSSLCDACTYRISEIWSMTIVVADLVGKARKDLEKGYKKEEHRQTKGHRSKEKKGGNCKGGSNQQR